MDNKILIIEDDKDILNVLKMILTVNNYEIIAISETNDILEEVKKYQPDLIITDFLLNGLNGGKICKIIKSSSEFCQLPVLLITAHSSFAELHGNFGFDAFISKPFEIEELLAVIKKLI